MKSLAMIVVAAASAAYAARAALSPGTYTAKVAALACASCAAKVTETMESIPGIVEVSVSKPRSVVTFTVKRGAKVSVESLQEQLREASREMGMGADYSLSGIKASEAQTSKYKLHVEQVSRSYRFDASGNPIAPEASVTSARSPRKVSAEGCSASADSCGTVAKAVYACPMGDYRGPNTKDGRCPKCGMQLQKQAE